MRSRGKPLCKEVKPWHFAAALFAVVGGVLLWQTHGVDETASGKGETSEMWRSKAGSSRPIQNTALSLKRQLDRMKEIEELGKNPVLFEKAQPGDSLGAVGKSEREIMASSWNIDSEPALAKFAEWAQAYIAGGGSASDREGVVMAQARREALARQIASDPRRALANALPFEIRSKLPASVQGLLERRIDAFGEMGTMYGCGEATAEGKEPYHLEEGYAIIDEENYRVHRYGKMANLYYAKEVAIHGIEIDGEIAVLDSSLRQVEPGEAVTGPVIDMASGKRGEEQDAKAIYSIGNGRYGSAPSDAYAEVIERALTQGANDGHRISEAVDSWATSWAPPEIFQAFSDGDTSGTVAYVGNPPISETTGTKSILIMRAQSPSMPLDPMFTPAAITTNMVNVGNAMLHRMSGGQYAINATITPVLNLPSSFTFETYDATAWHAKAQELATAAGYNLAQYNRLVLLQPYAPVGWVGLASGNRIWLRNNYSPSCFLHELGHTLGFAHAQSWFSSDPNDPIQSNATRTYSEYGDWDCLMGNNFDDAPTRTFNPLYKNKLHWLPNSTIRNVNRSGVYTIYQFDGEVNMASGLDRVLKVPRDSLHYYWLSIRGDTVGTGWENYRNGVTIRVSKPFYEYEDHTIHPILHNVNNPQPSGLINANGTIGQNAPISVGQEWSDGLADLKIECVEVGGSYPNRYAKVRVTFGPTHDAAHRLLAHGGIYRFSSRANSGVSMAGPTNTTSGQPLGMVANNDAATEQLWVSLRNADGTYSFNRLGTSLWLTVNGNAYANGTQMIQASATGNTSQKFYVTDTSDGYLYLIHAKEGGGNSGFVVNAALPSNVVQWSQVAVLHQHWKPEFVGILHNVTVRFVPKIAQGQAMDANWAQNYDGGQIELQPWNYGTNQKWVIYDAGGGFSTARSWRNYRYLSANLGPGNIDQWQSTGGTNQKWKMTRVGGHWFRMQSAADLARSIQATGIANGSPLNYLPNSSSENQLWRISDAWD